MGPCEQKLLRTENVTSALETKVTFKIVLNTLISGNTDILNSEMCSLSENSGPFCFKMLKFGRKFLFDNVYIRNFCVRTF